MENKETDTLFKIIIFNFKIKGPLKVFKIELFLKNSWKKFKFGKNVDVLKVESYVIFLF